jgi:hypothetical protein
MLSFHCPVCHKPLNAPEARAGKKGKCPSCRQLVEIPGTGTAPHESAQALISLSDSAERQALLQHPEQSPAEDDSSAPLLPHAPLAPPQVVVVSTHPLDVASVPAAATKLHESTESRTAYFAPAGYSASDPGAVAFMSPELRSRLQDAAARLRLPAPAKGSADSVRGPESNRAGGPAWRDQPHKTPEAPL